MTDSPTAAPGTVMTGRDRVLTTLAHREPDRVPIEFGSSQLSSLLIGPPYGYEALCELLGVTDYAEPVINVYLNSVKNIDPRIMRRFGADLRWVMAGGPGGRRRRSRSGVRRLRSPPASRPAPRRHDR